MLLLFINQTGRAMLCAVFMGRRCSRRGKAKPMASDNNIFIGAVQIVSFNGNSNIASIRLW
jgi:hypothetical protein